MKKCLSPLVMTLIGLLVVGVLTPSESDAWGWGCYDRNLQRLSAEYQFFEGMQFSTTAQVQGDLIYQKGVFVPDGCDTLYVTISGTASAEEDDMTDPTNPITSDLWLSCQIDTFKCNPGGFDTPAGWVQITEVDDDLSFYATWCIPLRGFFGPNATPNSYPVTIFMASDEPTLKVSVYTVHVYIDASFTDGGCQEGFFSGSEPPPPDENGGILQMGASAPPSLVPPVPTPTAAPSLVPAVLPSLP